MNAPFPESQPFDDGLCGETRSPSLASQPVRDGANSMFPQIQKQLVLATLIFVVFAPLIAHLLFSRNGMNPTDDGFFLGMGRRILDGEVPHRDFITARPAGTGILWMPVILLGGDYTIWISRFLVWFQLASIGWVWTLLAVRVLKPGLNLVEQMVIALIAFIVTAHNWSLTPFPSVDGLWMGSIGLALCLSKRPWFKFSGYVLVGATCIFKQNFLALGPVFLVVLGDWRRFRYWVAWIAPALAYVAFMWLSGGFADFRMQLTSHTELIHTGVGRFLHSRCVFAGLVLAYFGLLAISGRIGARWLNLSEIVRAWLVSLGTVLVMVPPSICLVRSFQAAAWYSFMTFGITAGVLLFFICHRRASPELIKITTLVLAMMWTVSISIGYNYPVLGGGAAVALVACYLRTLLPPDETGNKFRIVWRSCLFASAMITAIFFVVGRNCHIYMEQPAWKLTCSLDGVLHGGRMIKTNPVTYQYMKELHDEVDRLQGREYAVLPDAAIWWVKSPQKNPLPTSWPLDFELGTPALFDRFVQALETRRGRTVFLLAKVMGFNLVNQPAPNYWYTIVPYVRSHFRRVDETQYWEIYE